jgi:hypothetical protein
LANCRGVGSPLAFADTAMVTISVVATLGCSRQYG